MFDRKISAIVAGAALLALTARERCGGSVGHGGPSCGFGSARQDDGSKSFKSWDAKLQRKRMGLRARLVLLAPLRLLSPLNQKRRQAPGKR